MTFDKPNHKTNQGLNQIKNGALYSKSLRLALGLAATALFVGCSGDSAGLPTVASELPGGKAPSSSRSASVPAGSEGFEEGLNAVQQSCRELGQKKNCGAFDQVRLTVEQIAPGKARIRYMARGFAFQAFYVVRFWPEGRHQGVPQDFPIGLRKPGDRPISGEFIAEIPVVSRQTSQRYNVDLDLWGDEGYFRAGDLSCQDQCDRGGEMILSPPVVDPPEPGDSCICHVNDMGQRLPVCGAAVANHTAHVRDAVGSCSAP